MKVNASITQAVDVPTTDIYVSLEDPIEVLDLGPCLLNVLRGASICTIGELVRSIEAGRLTYLHYIGPKSMARIKDSLTRVRLVGAPEPVDESDTSLSDGTSTQADASPTQTVDIPTIRIRVSSGDPIEVLGLSVRTFDALMHASIRTIGELVQTVESANLREIRGIGSKAIVEIDDSLARVRLVDAPEAILSPKTLAEESVPETESHAVEPLLPQPPSPLLYPTPLDALGLSTRSYNILMRRDITTVEQLARMSDEEIKGVRNIGPKSLAEIQEKLQVYLSANPTLATKLPKASARGEPPSGTPLPDGTSTQAMVPITQIVEVKVPVISKEVIKWQARLIEKQISAGLLHEQAKIVGNSIAYWLSVFDVIDRHQAYGVMASVLGASINICEELAFLFDWIQHDYVEVLLSRYGFEPKTVKETGVEIGAKPQRVSQIAIALKKKMGARVSSVVGAKSVNSLAIRPPLLRMQSALLAAKDMGMDITYEEWEQSIRSSGLVGIWTSQDYMAIDPVEAMIAVCNLLADGKIQELRIPSILNYAIELATSGTPDLPARILHIRKTLPKETSKLIKKHTRFSGSVHARWLSQEIGKGMAQVKNMLQAFGYRELSKNWFVPRPRSKNYKIHRNHVFHHALRKMSQHCGPLTIDDICSGIRYAVSRTNFPVPPPDVMGQILQMYGYQNEGGLYYWDGEMDEELNRGESIIMNGLAQNGPVVHHAELAQAFIDSELSFPSLHGTLQRSPLFARIDKGLYKLRGKPVTSSLSERLLSL